MRAGSTSAAGFFAAILALLMGMGGPPGCTGTETALDGREGARTDYYLPGRWHVLDVTREGAFVAGPLRLEVSLADSGGLRFALHEVDSDPNFYAGWFTGYPTRLGSRKYLNLRFDIPEYVRKATREGDQTPAEIVDGFARMPCPYLIVQYSTFLSRSEAAWMSAQVATARRWDDWEASPESDEIAMPEILGEEDPVLTRKLLAEARKQPGNLLFFSVMDNGFVEEAIAQGLVDGVQSCDDCLGACIQADETELRAFIQEHDLDLFPGWEWLIRVPATGR